VLPIARRRVLLDNQEELACSTHHGLAFPLSSRSPDCYAPAIERIASFADYLIHPLELDEYEAVDSVVVTNKQGQQRTVADTSYNYDRKAKLLRFNAGVLTAQDESLAVNVARECHIVIP
jgi:hypothetical protein